MKQLSHFRLATLLSVGILDQLGETNPSNSASWVFAEAKTLQNCEDGTVIQDRNIVLESCTPECLSHLFPDISYNLIEFFPLLTWLIDQIPVSKGLRH